MKVKREQVFEYGLQPLKETNLWPSKNGWGGLRQAGPGPHPQDVFGLGLRSVCLATAPEKEG